MPKKKDKTESALRPEISRELDRIMIGKQKTDKADKNGWPKEEKFLERMQKSMVKEARYKILRGEKFNKHKKVDKKIGGVRGKFHPSLERTRKRT